MMFCRGKIRFLVEKERLQENLLQEIRLRTGQPLILIYRDREVFPMQDGKPYRVQEEDLKETLEYVSNYSLYAYEQEMRQGFITMEGGHRVGMTGQAIMEKGQIKNLKYISSLNIRVSHEKPGCADQVLPYLIRDQSVCHTLLVSPPRCGKTTLLRDLIRQISDGTPAACRKDGGRGGRALGDRRMLPGCGAEQAGKADRHPGRLPESGGDDDADPFHGAGGDRSG